MITQEEAIALTLHSKNWNEWYNNLVKLITRNGGQYPEWWQALHAPTLKQAKGLYSWE